MIVKSILEKMGYKPEVQGGSPWMRMKALYRNSNSLSLAVNKETGWYTDFVTNQTGPLFKLAMLTLNISEEEARNFLYGSYKKDTEVKPQEVEKVDQPNYFSDKFLDDLLPSYGFYLNKGISKSVLEEFQSGVKTYGKLNNRFVFPIFDHQKKIVGVAGRDLLPKSERPKWKLLGVKNKFVYPQHLSLQHIERESQVVLVESIGDALAMYENGIRNVLVVFGLSVSKSILLFLIRCNVQDIVLAFNNDSDSEDNRGLAASKNNKEKLCKFFKSENIRVCPPSKKDFGEMSPAEINSWALNNSVNQIKI